MEKEKGGDNLKIDPRVELICAMESSAIQTEHELRLQFRELLSGIFRVAGIGGEFQQLL